MREPGRKTGQKEACAREKCGVWRRGKDKIRARGRDGRHADSGAKNGGRGSSVKTGGKSGGGIAFRGKNGYNEKEREKRPRQAALAKQGKGGDKSR